MDIYYFIFIDSAVDKLEWTPDGSILVVGDVAGCLYIIDDQSIVFSQVYYIIDDQSIVFSQVYYIIDNQSIVFSQVYYIIDQHSITAILQFSHRYTYNYITNGSQVCRW